MTEQLVLPFYVLADVSYSMTQVPKGGDGEAPLTTLNGLVVTVKDALDVDPILSDKIRFALVDFSDDAQTQIPLCDLSKMDTASIPTLVGRGGTSYAAAFTAIRHQIDADVRQLKADGHKVYRPALFFLTDGEPSDADADWQRAFAELTDESFKARPNIIPFGVGDARKEVLDRLVYPVGKMRAFITKEGVDPAAAIRSMAEILVGSVLASATSVSSDGTSGGFALPDPEEDELWL